MTHQADLDELGLDDRISTGRLHRPRRGRADPLLADAGALADAVYDWWRGAPPGLVYRTRTIPAARSIAYTEAVAWKSTAARPLREATGLLVGLVLRHGFCVPEQWLA